MFLSNESEYPAQGAYVGFLLTDYLSSLVTGRLVDVEMEDNCPLFHLEMDQYDDACLELVGALQLLVTFHRGTVSLLCPTEEWWPTMEESWIFRRLWAIAEHCGCLVALASAETNAARVADPTLENKLEGAVVLQPSPTLQ